MIYERVLRERQKLETKINSLQRQLEELPDGKLICSGNGKYYKWYRTDGHKKIYIPKKERNLAEKLALKKYLSLQLKNLLHEKNAIDFYLRHHDSGAYQMEQSLINSPGYNELLFSSFKPLSHELSEWMNSPYEKNNKYPEKLNYRTYSGNYVRSKSEAIIEMFLCKYKIPFRYECALQLGEVHIFPDFTIRHPKTGELYYWEHFGLMDDLSYIKNTTSKIQLYASNGIIPTIQLITTYETKENPLNTEMVEKIVQDYFC